MPSGNVHTTASIVLGVAGGMAAYYNGVPLPQALALAGGSLLGTILTPDLDIPRGPAAGSRRAGCLGMFWGLYWAPYSMLLPHRSPVSHWPVISTAVRLLYCYGLLLPLWYLLGALGQLPTAYRLLPWVFLGLAAADTLHWILDKTIRN